MNTFLLLIYPLFILIFGFVFYKLAPKLNLIDIPNHRKRHEGNIPIIGGIIGGTSILLFSFLLIDDQVLKFIILMSFIILIVGIIDDLYDINFSYRLILQFIIILFVIGNGISITSLGEYNYFGNLSLGVFGIFLTVLSISALTNSLNFIDGSDGLCAGMIISSFLCIIIFSFENFSKHYEFFYLILVFLFIFLIFNLFSKNHKVFLGDSGSTFFGFMLSLILIYFTTEKINYFHPCLVPWFIAVPIYDSLRVITYRIIKKNNPFLPDETHLHHALMKLNFNRYQIFIIVTCLQSILVLIGYLSSQYINPDTSMILFPVIFILYILIISKLESTIKISLK